MPACDAVDMIDAGGLVRLGLPGVPLAERLRTVLAEAIGAGRPPPGAGLPSIRAMARFCGVSPDTVVSAYQRLKAAGIVTSTRGSGFYVSARAATDRASPAIETGWRTGASGIAGLERSPLDPAREQPGSGSLHPGLLQGDVLARALRVSLRTRPELLVARGDPAGYRPLRQQLRHRLDRIGIRCETDDILTGNGATALINVAIRTFVRPGSAAMVEVPGPPLHHNLLLSQGAVPLPLRRDRDGPDPVMLRALCEAHRPVMLLCASVHQNPTGGGIAPNRAHEILRLAEEFDFRIIDDTSYADLRPADAPIWIPLGMLDDLRRVIHIGSFSPLLGPSLGVGYLATRPDVMPWLLPYAAVHGGGFNITAERAAFQLLEDEQFDRRQRRIALQVAEARHDVLAQLARLGLPPSPAGSGLYAWLNLGTGIDAHMAAQELAARAIVLASPTLFSRDPMDRSFTRLNVTTTTAHDMAALAAVLDAMRGDPAMSAPRTHDARDPSPPEDRFEHGAT